MHLSQNERVGVGPVVHKGVHLYNPVFTEYPFKSVSGDVTAFHRISPDELIIIIICRKTSVEIFFV